MSGFLNQNFDDDEESDNDFQPAVERGSDDEGDDEQPVRSKSRVDSDDEQEPRRRSVSRGVNGDSSPPSKPPRRRSDEAEEGNDDDEEDQDGDNGEDDEGEGEDLGRDEDDEEEDEDEDDEGPRSRPKKRRRGLNQFFEEEAEVDEDDDDLEGDDEGLGNEFIDETHPDDDLPVEGDTDDRRHKELDRRREFEATMDAEKRAQELKEKYGRRTQASLASGSFVPQNLLMHDVSKDPTLFNVKCKPGKEKEIISKIMRKCEEAVNNRRELLILSAFERGEGDGPMAGCLFVEAESKAKAQEFLAGISDVYPHSKMQIVPSNEMPDCLRVVKSKVLTPGSYVRVKKGLYTGDLAIVEDVTANAIDVVVKLVPRLTYGLDEDDTKPNGLGDNKRKRPGFGNVVNVKNRPEPKLFSEAEARKKHARHLQTNRSLTYKEYTYKGETYVDGFLIKSYKLNQLTTENVQPKLDETQRFAKAGQDGSETLDLETLKHSLHDNASAEASYQVGDDVEVWRGEQRGLVGKTERVTQGILTLRVNEGELLGQLVETPIKDIRKRFREGDNVIVGPGSKYAGQTGMISSIDKDKATLITQDSNNEITTFIKDLAKASGVSGSTERSKFDVRDLVQLTTTTFGCVVGVDAQSVRVMNQNGTIETRLPSSISIIETSRNAVAVDKNGSEIRIGDSVKEASGEAKSGSILHIYRNYLFAHDRTRMIENAGIWVARNTNVISRSTRGGAPLTDLTKMNPALRQPGADSSMGPPQKPGLDKLIRQHVKITKGQYKGHRGRVKDATAGEARVELESKNKVINISKMNLSVVK
jgi:transcription elongation factor SPT5